MTKKLKSYLKFGILLLGISIFFTSCENETIEEPILAEENSSNPYFKTGKLQDFNSLNTYAKELEQKSKTQSNALNRSTIEDDNGFTILEGEDVFVYTGTTSTTYTLVIQKDNQSENTFSNLVVKFNNEAPTKAFIMNYTPNDGFIEAHNEDDQTPFEGAGNYEALDYDGSLDGLSARAGCYTVTVTYCNWGGETHAAGSNCTPGFIWSETHTFCPNEEQDNSIDPPTGPSGGGGSTSTSDPDPNADNPPEDGEECLLDSNGNCLNDTVTDPLPPNDGQIGGFEEEEYFETNPEQWVVYEEAPGDTIDLNEYLDCFDNAPTTATFKFTVYVDQPIPNQDDTWTNDGTLLNPDINVGHTFISLEMNDGGTITNQTIGFYPSAGVNPTSPQIAGAWIDDGNHGYDVSASIDIDHTQFTGLINSIETLGTPTYNLNSLNCTDAAIQVGNSTGMNLPDTDGSWIGGGGSNPGNLGQDVRGLNSSNLTINTTAGTASLSAGPCN